MTPEHELHHIDNGPDPAEEPGGIGLVTFDVACDGNAQQVYDRAREVLRVVIEQYKKPWWPSLEAWKQMLPQWFVEACAPEQTHEEAERWSKWWSSLPHEEQQRAEAALRWSVKNWIYWFERINRHWYWWDALVDSPDEMRVAVQVDAWPFPWGSLRWLLKAAGAEDLTSEPDEDRTTRKTFEPLNDSFDKTTPIPRAADLFYECLRCHDVVASIPKDNVGCSCGVFFVDIDSFRVAIEDYARFRILRERR